VIKAESRIVIVNHNPAACDVIASLLQRNDLKRFHSAETFLDSSAAEQAHCLLIDYVLPGISGLELLKHLTERGLQPGIIFVTKQVNISLAVEAMRGGALSVLEEPWEQVELSELIQNAIELAKQNLQAQEQRKSLQQKVSQLAPQHKRVLDLLLDGNTIRTTARSLDCQTTQVEQMFEEIYSCLQADSPADLARLLLDVETLDFAEV